MVGPPELSAWPVLQLAPLGTFLVLCGGLWRLAKFHQRIEDHLRDNAEYMKQGRQAMEQVGKMFERIMENDLPHLGEQIEAVRRLVVQASSEGPQK